MDLPSVCPLMNISEIEAASLNGSSYTKAVHHLLTLAWFSFFLGGGGSSLLMSPGSCVMSFSDHILSKCLQRFLVSGYLGEFPHSEGQRVSYVPQIKAS